MADPEITRRRFLAVAACSAAAAALGACGARGPTTSPPSPSPTPSPIVATPAPRPPVPLRERIARLLVVGFRGLAVDADSWIARAIADEGLGGVILFDRDAKRGPVRNVESPAQVAELVQGLQTLAPSRRLVVAIDQEGGRVTRLGPAHGFPALSSQAAVGEQGDAAVRGWAAGLAATLASVGVNLNLAPVVDLDVNPDNPAIGVLDRAFSADAGIVARDAGIEIEEHRRRGVRTAVKHFPGIGSATANTDFGVADVTTSWSEDELRPYRELSAAGLLDAVMVGHVVNGQIDPTAPASLSPASVDGLLRAEIGFRGVAITDDLQAGAIADRFGFEDSVALALLAGNDLLLLANQQVFDRGVVRRAVDHIERLVGDGTVPESRIDEAVLRVDALLRS